MRAIWPMARLAHIISWVLITALGMPVLPEVNRNLPTVLASICSIERATASVGLVATSSLHGSDCICGGALSTWTSSTPSRSERRASAPGIDLAVLHEHHAGLDEVEDVAQLGVVLAHHRIGGRHRRQRRARLHGRHGEQRELDRVARTGSSPACPARSRDRAAPGSPHRPAAWPRHRSPSATRGPARGAAPATRDPAPRSPTSPGTPARAFRRASACGSTAAGWCRRRACRP